MVKYFLIIFFILNCPLAFSQSEQDSLNSLDEPETDEPEFFETRIINVESSRYLDDYNFSFYKHSGLNSAEDILSRVEGISFIKRGAYGLEPVIRGLSDGQISVSIDGMRVFGACTDKMDPSTSYVETDNLSSIELSHGSFNSFNSSGLGGSLDLHLAEPLFDRKKNYFVKLESGYQSVSKSPKLSLVSNYNTDRVAFRLNAVYRKADDYTAGNGQVINYSGYKKSNFTFSSIWKISSSDMLDANLIFDDAYDIGYPALLMDVGYAKARIGGLNYIKLNPFSLIEKLELKAYVNKIDHSMDDTHRENVAMHMDMPGSTRTIGGSATAYFKTRVQNDFNLKLDYYNLFAKAEMTMYPVNAAPMYMVTWPDIERNVFGGSLSKDLKLSHDAALNFTGRIDMAVSKITSDVGMNELEIFYPALNNSFNNYNANASVNLAFIPKDDLKLTANIGYAQRIPTVSEQFGFYLFNRFDNYDYIGDPYLKDEKSLQSQIGASMIVGMTEIRATAFVYKFFDYIKGYVDSSLTPMTIGANGVKRYENINGALLTGGELTVSYVINKDAHFASTINYTYGEDNSGNPLPLIPPLKGNLLLKYHPSFVTLQVDGNWSARQNRVDPQSGEIKTPGFVVFNFRATKQIIKGLEINAGVENIFDKEYYEHLDWSKIPRPGRNFYGVISYSF